MRSLWYTKSNMYTLLIVSVDSMLKVLSKDRSSAFNTFGEVKDVATSSRQDQANLPVVMWVPKTNNRELVIIRTQQAISIAHLQEVVRTFQATIMGLLSDIRLTFGTGDLLMTFIQWVGTELPIISDDMSNHSPGYSFITEQQNQFGSLQQVLLSAIFSDPKTRADMIDKVDGNGNIFWN